MVRNLVPPSRVLVTSLASTDARACAVSGQVCACLGDWIGPTCNTSLLLHPRYMPPTGPRAPRRSPQVPAAAAACGRGRGGRVGGTDERVGGWGWGWWWGLGGTDERVGGRGRGWGRGQGCETRSNRSRHPLTHTTPSPRGRSPPAGRARCERGLQPAGRVTLQAGVVCVCRVTLP